MPINLEDELKRRRQNTSDLISLQKSSIPTDIANTRSGVQSTRQQFFSDVLDPRISGMTGANVARNAATGSLDRSLNSKLAGRARQETTTGVSRTFEVAYQRAVDAGLDEQDAVNYARQVELQSKKMSFEAEMAQKAREQALTQQDISDRYAGYGVDLANQYSTSPDYSGALYRALFGLAGTAGTGAALSYFGKNKTTTTPTVKTEGIGGYYGQ